MLVVIWRLSGPRSSSSVYSDPVDQALLTAVMSGVRRTLVPLLIHVAIPLLRMLAFWERSQSKCLSAG